MSGPVSTEDGPLLDPEGEQPEPPCLERFASRAVDLGGTPVRRALPRRGRRTVGAWCFVDHFGPAGGTGAPGSMAIGPHPHIGLQTVTWLLSGEVLHTDSLGSEQPIRPGQLNLMTAGRGVAHAEQTPQRRTPVQHGAQLWVAQPEATRHAAPAFEHHADLPRHDLGGGLVATVIVGEHAGTRSPARTDTPIVGLAVTAEGAADAEVALDRGFEHALVVLDGTLLVGEQVVEPGELAYLGEGRDSLPVATSGPVHALLLGGEPFPDELLMWWNFVARDRPEVEEARADWQDHHERFGRVPSVLRRIDAPPLPWS